MIERSRFAPLVWLALLGGCSSGGALYYGAAPDLGASAGPFDLSTGGGRLDLSTGGRPIDLSTGGGPIDLSTPRQPLDLATPSCGGCGGLLCCGTRCVDPMNDPNNCGGCGRACPPGNVCSGGNCTCGCKPGLT
jgi:hypothetical protein